LLNAKVWPSFTLLLHELEGGKRILGGIVAFLPILYLPMQKLLAQVLQRLLVWRSWVREEYGGIDQEWMRELQSVEV
jgi:hypothetical protein